MPTGQNKKISDIFNTIKKSEDETKNLKKWEKELVETIPAKKQDVIKLEENIASKKPHSDIPSMITEFVNQFKDDKTEDTLLVFKIAFNLIEDMALEEKNAQTTVANLMQALKQFMLFKEENKEQNILLEALGLLLLSLEEHKGNKDEMKASFMIDYLRGEINLELNQAEHSEEEKWTVEEKRSLKEVEDILKDKDKLPSVRVKVVQEKFDALEKKIDETKTMENPETQKKKKGFFAAIKSFFEALFKKTPKQEIKKPPQVFRKPHLEGLREKFKNVIKPS